MIMKIMYEGCIICFPLKIITKKSKIKGLTTLLCYVMIVKFEMSHTNECNLRLHLQTTPRLTGGVDRHFVIKKDQKERREE